MPFQNQFRLKIRKSKRHTEHYSRLTQNPVQTERAPTIHYTPNLYTEHVIINSNVLLFLEFKNNIWRKCYYIRSFFESLFFSPLSFCFHYCWGRERRKRCLLTDLRFVFNLQGKKQAEQKRTLPTFSSLATSLLPLCCQSAPVFQTSTDHPVAVDKMKNNYRNIHFKEKSTL